MTGGSSLIPAVRKSIVSLMPNARLIEGDKFGSVAMGLALSARENLAGVKPKLSIKALRLTVPRPLPR